MVRSVTVRKVEGGSGGVAGAAVHLRPDTKEEGGPGGKPSNVVLDDKVTTLLALPVPIREML